MRVFLGIMSRLPDVYPFVSLDFLVIGNHLAVEASKKHVVILMLDKVVVQFCSIDKTEDLLELTVKTHLLPKPSVGSSLHLFAVPWVTTYKLTESEALPISYRMYSDYMFKSHSAKTTCR